ncbi:L,D-transpeptidase scaffold domain-containing protein [Hymenobacter jejuensis]|uniref:L,D-TPase catalytic domain-containing protein n=1 Tax=Hymenobacter jejuensis TaxID=2502781 RepID=A0A5B8A1F2_9BACT|nr:L,D-transpeptidase family protein [Hymenobacter jejuensis]QDA61211.1 hypothetical protein FHG12_14375 [Hymenobacter jejuensis]
MFPSLLLRFGHSLAVGGLVFLMSFSMGTPFIPASAGEVGAMPHSAQLPADLSAALREICTASALHTTDAVTEQVQQFYTLGGYAPVWTNENGPTDNARAGLQLLVAAQRYGLKPAEYEAAPLRSLLDSLQANPAQLQQRLTAEVRLTTALLRFSQHLYRGRIENSSVRAVQMSEEQPFEAAAHLSQALHSERFAQQLLTAQPNSRSYVRLLAAWQRLLQSDTAAARKMALPVALNLERLRWEPRVDSLYLVVNIPAYSLQVVRGAQVVRSHRVVVGKIETPTPEMYSKLSFFQTAPEWRMPQSIATKEVLPKLKRDRGYLASKGFRLYDQAGDRVDASEVNWSKISPANFAFQIRQAPSSRNALGNVVFRFANPYEIYLHDTPAKEAFQANYRALSHGCIRLQHASDLARFLLTRDSQRTKADRVEQMENSIDEGETKSFGLRAAVPLMVRYQTLDADGAQLRQLPDIYHRDETLARAWEGAPVEFASAATAQ